MIEDNYIGFVPSLTSEFDCRNECKRTSGCNFYTYFLQDDLHHGSCYLLSSPKGPFEECPTCVTGALDCENFEEDNCGFIYNGQMETHMMFTEPGVEVEFNSSLTVFTSCKLRVMAVGGGGHGGSFGGGGSGYIQYLSQNLTHVPPTTLIKLAVGDKGEASNVTINGNKVMALPGEDGVASGGGGYSGGVLLICYTTL